MALKKWMSICGVKIGTKMNKPPTVVVDADAIIAQADPNDKHHLTAIKISEFLANTKAQVVYPVTAITYGTAVIFTDPSVQVAEVNQEVIKSALKYFNPKTSKKNTLFDCIIAAIAKEKQADAIFSFDKFYPRNGFKLASDLQV